MVALISYPVVQRASYSVAVDEVMGLRIVSGVVYPLVVVIHVLVVVVVVVVDVDAVEVVAFPEVLSAGQTVEQFPVALRTAVVKTAVVVVVRPVVTVVGPAVVVVVALAYH